MKKNLEVVTGDLVQTSSETAKTADVLKKVSLDLEDKVDEQHKISKEVIETTRGLGIFLEKQISNANNSVNDLQELMQGIWEGFERSKEVSKLISRIEKTTRIITKVAKKTEVLAMNAGIQAAQAGEYGKGFHVISQEIKKLATLCQEAAKDIENSVGEAIDRAEKISAENEVVQNHSVEKSNSVVEVFGRIISFYNDTNENTPNTKKINSLMEKADAISGKVKDIAGEVKLTASDLSTQVEDTNRVVSDIIGCVYNREITDLNPQQAFQKLNDFEIIDVRREDEYTGELGRIEGARLITINENFSENIQLLPKDSVYLFVCRSGGRSSRAARIAQMAGFNHVFNLSGGMLAWNEEQLPVVGGEFQAA